MTQVAQMTLANPALVRPFPQIHYSDAELSDLRNRVNAMRFPTRELVPDQSQGVQLATMQALAKYWGSDYDWRKC